MNSRKDTTLTSDVDPGIQIGQYLQPVFVESDGVDWNVGDRNVFPTQQGLDILHRHLRIFLVAENLYG